MAASGLWFTHENNSMKWWVVWSVMALPPFSEKWRVLTKIGHSIFCMESRIREKFSLLFVKETQNLIRLLSHFTCIIQSQFVCSFYSVMNHISQLITSTGVFSLLNFNDVFSFIVYDLSSEYKIVHLSKCSIVKYKMI